MVLRCPEILLQREPLKRADLFSATTLGISCAVVSLLVPV